MSRSLRIRYRLTEEQSRRVDKQRVREQLAEVADHVQLEDDVIREKRARVEGLSETMGLADAVDLYLAASDLGDEELEQVRAEHARYEAWTLTREDKGETGAYRPIRTEAENYGPFPSLAFDYEPGISVILGTNRDNPGVDSNGSGKSFLVNAPAVCLFGHTPDGASLADLMLNDGSAERMTLLHEFRVGGETYRVRRSLSGKQTLELEWNEQTAFGWQPVAGPGVREAQEAIVRLLGFTEQTFLASALMVQGSASFASKATSRVEKCELLADGLGLEEYEALRALAEADRKRAERDVVRLADRLERDAVELERLPEAENELLRFRRMVNGRVEALEDAQEEVDKHAARLQEAKTREADRRAAEAEYARVGAERRRLQERFDAAEAAREHIAGADAHIATLGTQADADSAQAEYERELREWSAVSERRASLTAEIARLRSESVCPTCKRPFDDRESIEWAVESCRMDLEKLPALEAPSDLRLRLVREQATERARLEERIAGWQVALSRAPSTDELRTADLDERAASERLHSFTSSGPDLDEIERDLALARLDASEAQHALDVARAGVARYEADVERLTALKAKHDAEEREHAEAQRKAALAARMERMYSRDGIPSHIIENVAAPFLEQEATRVLHRLGLAWRVEIHVQAENKSGTLRPALDVLVIRENGVVQPYALASGGEDARAGCALRVAFARLFKQRGAHSELFALDEPAYLDQAGLSAFVALLEELAQEFSVVQLISHDSGLRDAFDSVVEVVRENGRSRVAA